MLLHCANHRPYINGPLDLFSIVDPKPEPASVRDDRILENGLKRFGKCFDGDFYLPVALVPVSFLPFVDVGEERFICEIRESLQVIEGCDWDMLPASIFPTGE